MSLPKITAFIGENISQKNKSEFSSVIKNAKKVKEKEVPYIVFLVLDLSKEQIYFQLDKRMSENSVFEYYYFGNNSAAAAQCYLTRQTNSIKYLLTNAFGDLYQTLVKYGMQESQLAILLKKLEDKEFMQLGEKKGEGKLNLSKFSIVQDNKVNKIALDEKKNIEIDDKRHNPEAFIRLFIEDDNKNNKFVLVVPKVILESEEEIVLSTHIDYLEVIKKVNNLGAYDKEDDDKKEKKVCYICKKQKSDVSSKYSKKFSRTGINKIFTTTTINTSQFLQKFDYDNTYSICSDCYQKLLTGEKIISKEFKSRIAGEDVFIVPEALMANFDYNSLNILKKDVDLAFKSDDAKTWVENINMIQDIDDVGLYTVSFVFYRTDGNSVTVLETIEDVPTLRLKKVMEILADYTEILESHTKKISLGSIYRLIPVKTNNNKEQIDIGRVLSLYKALLSGEQVAASVLYSYAVEALEKGLRQLGKSKIDNYLNMGIKGYLEYEDFFIKRIIFGYIVLLKTCQELNVLDKEVFEKNEEGGQVLNKINTPSEKVNSSIMKIETFLDEQGFVNDARALFYLGILVNRVAIAQYQKEHKTKPILKKIQFQGMNEKDLYRLYGDIVEKLRQYEKMNLFVEGIMNRFHNYFGTLEKSWSLSDQENVFYIMAGYSYMIGNKSPDLSKDEIEAQKQTIEEFNENIE
ncbi:TM1802 family CRISPR-associated protein [Anaerosalibacter sp. Marseille-P3206]|uniref:TM1802 family CRISPR-associated protein n=1 Tax=Anaerosalibacter sp. Marseille-P3206 TaxID=1871005 RepID=UPI0009874FF4|nr:TM1802 family CRISPR-associated protein [Anaerosalibacter sp. Marseille-P3206]